MWPRGLSVLQEEPQHRTEVSGLQTGDHWQGHHPGENIREVLQDEDRQRCRHHRGPGGGGGGAGVTGAEKYKMMMGLVIIWLTNRPRSNITAQFVQKFLIR